MIGFLKTASPARLGLRTGRLRWLTGFLVQKRTLQDDTEAHLERLAEAAPHMLADIGFVVDPWQSSAEATVWRRGNHTVETGAASRPCADAAGGRCHFPLRRY